MIEQLHKALIERLSLQEQEIRLRAEAAKALIEQDAQTKIIAARIAARKEIDENL